MRIKRQLLLFSFFKATVKAIKNKNEIRQSLCKLNKFNRNIYFHDISSILGVVEGVRLCGYRRAHFFLKLLIKTGKSAISLKLILTDLNSLVKIMKQWETCIDVKSFHRFKKNRSLMLGDV